MDSKGRSTLLDGLTENRTSFTLAAFMFLLFAGIGPVCTQRVW